MQCVPVYLSDVFWSPLTFCGETHNYVHTQICTEHAPCVGWPLSRGCRSKALESVLDSFLPFSTPTLSFLGFSEIIWLNTDNELTCAVHASNRNISSTTIKKLKVKQQFNKQSLQLKHYDSAHEVLGCHSCVVMNLFIYTVATTCVI